MNGLQKALIFNEMVRKMESDNKKEWSFEEVAEIMKRRVNIPKKETFRILKELAAKLQEKK